MRTTGLIALALLLSACDGADKDPDCCSPGDDTGSQVVDEDGDGSSAEEDCDDYDAEAYPGADEVCDGVDNDCDGDVDEDGAVGSETVYLDADGDGFGDEDEVLVSCELLDGYVTNADDCDDGDDGVYPGADETCDEVDEDCDGEVDEDAVDGGAWYTDEDGDGFGDADARTLACEAPSGAVEDDTDCDDGDGSVNPDADEACDGVDNDCDDDVDEDVTLTFYEDSDGDGYGLDDVPVEVCGPEDGLAVVGGDCDDDDDTTWPDADELCDGVDNDCDGEIDDDATSMYYLDSDGDGYGDEETAVEACDAPSGYVGVAGDCDDERDDLSPDADEVCDGEDNDCDDEVDGEASIDALTWYGDADEDGYGDPAVATIACDAPSGMVGNDSDCDDEDDDVSPDAVEICDEIDNDCDGEADGEDAADASTWYADADGDGWGLDADELIACELPDGFTDVGGDCDDEDAEISPGADEVCDGQDNDCDEETDEDDAIDAGSWYADEDGDDYGDPATETVACDAPDGTVSDGTDCDDDDRSTFPGADEYCDGINNDCDEETDEDALDMAVFYADEDEDGYGDPEAPTEACEEGSGLVSDATDCDDTDALVNPGVDETWYDGVDADCGGDDDYDADLDGYATPDGGGEDCDDTDDAISPGAAEALDQLDNDCDGMCDEDFISYGDLVITEFLADPGAVTDSYGEWFEVLNVADYDLAICGGWSIADEGSDDHEITGDFVIAAGAYAVFGRTDDTSINGGVEVDYVYGLGWTMANTEDEIELLFDGTLIDEVWYDEGETAWAKAAGRAKSFQLDPSSLDADANDDGTLWCESSSSFGEGDKGTPGYANEACF